MNSPKLNIKFDETLLDTYTDEEVVYHFRQSPVLFIMRPERIRVLSHHLVAKSISRLPDHRDEVDAMETARSVGINVPAVRRIVPLPNGGHIIIMERIHGENLEQLWPRLGIWATIRIAWQLRSFISVLRTVTSQTTGGLHSGQTESEWIQSVNLPVPHASPSLFCDYLNWWLVKARPSNCLPLPHLLLSPAHKHVLVHQDLAPRNMILDLRGRLWLVDWGYSGFYPAFMEYLGMVRPNEPNIYLSAWTRMRWSLFQLIACGYSRMHYKGLKALDHVRQRSLRFRLERPVHSQPQ